MEKMKNYCEHCDDGTGKCVYPYYGVAPHHCYYKHGGGVGESIVLDSNEWPKNFTLDPDQILGHGCGVYEYCMICGSKN